MNRRSFLRGAAVAPVIAVGAAIPAISAPGGFSRVSCEKGDPGERAYGIACAERKQVDVYLDGVKQKFALTADAKEGWVKRWIEAGNGRPAFNPATEEVLTEVVYGRVEIRLAPKA